jgi:hypothetical protein
MPGRYKNDEGKEVIHTLKPEAMPAAPTGPEHPNMPSRGDYLLPAASTKQTFAALVDAPVLNHATREITMGKKMQGYVDPEHYIAGTKNYPGANEMTGTDRGLSERAVAQHLGQPTPAYGGSTDARTDPSGGHRSTEAVWTGKEEDVTSPAGATKSYLNNKGETMQRKVRSAGLFARLMGGEKILNPAHHIIDPSPPKYGPRVLTNTELDPQTGKPTKVSADDAGGFGHDQPVQWEGHHRMMASALKQKAQREAGVKDWAVPVPVDIHFGTDTALSNKSFIDLSEGIVEQQSRRKSALRGMLSGTRGGGPDPNNPKPPRRVLGSRMAPGTWNSKAY